MKECKDMYLTIPPGKTWRVVGAFNSLEHTESGILVDGKAYIGLDDGYVRIFSLHKPKEPNRYPYFWKDKDGKTNYSHPTGDIMDLFKSANITDISAARIARTTKPEDVLLDEKALNDMNSAAAIFRPLIEDSDDFLKKIVKTVIIEKEIDISRLKSRMERQYSLPNMKAALNNTTKMSVSYFLQWMELLGCNFTITVEDNGSDDVNPLDMPITFDSTTGKLTQN